MRTSRCCSVQPSRRCRPARALFLLLAIYDVAATSTPRSSRWWFGSHSDAYVTQALQIVKQHRKSITGIYTYLGFAVHANGSFTSPATELVKARMAPFLDLGLTVGVALGLNQSAVESGAALKAVGEATKAANRANLTSLMIDYEPSTNVSEAHARAYATFVKSLAEALHATGRSLEMCVSSWSILTRFGLYASTGVDGMMTMAATYFGSNITKNEGWVAQELVEGVTLDQLRVGIGSMNSIWHKWDYNWTSARLEEFTSWLATRGIRHLDVWRTDIDSINATNGTADWIYAATAKFLREPECTPPGMGNLSVCGHSAPPSTPGCCGAATCEQLPFVCGGPPHTLKTFCVAPPPPPPPKCKGLGDSCLADIDCCPDWQCHSITCQHGTCVQSPPPPSSSPPDLATASSAITASDATLLKLTRLPSTLVERMGARCLDGSGGGYYFKAASTTANATKLVVAIEGGGECRTAAECAAWRGGSGPSSASWPEAHTAEGFSELSSVPEVNPDFHDWAKLFLPYCSADMHSGRRTTREAALGGFYFAGHNLIAASLAHLANHTEYHEPQLVLVTGSSAGGIAALLHADFFSRHFEAAVVKVSPACGFFYAGVSSMRDWKSNRTTPKEDLGFLTAWEPYIDGKCTEAYGEFAIAACTDAHLALPYIQTPLFLRENLFDTAKLANCGLDARGPLLPDQVAYIRAWGGWMKAQLDSIAAPGSVHFNKTGYFAPSCLNHGENLDFRTAPPLHGSTMRDALRAWFFPEASPAATPPLPPRLVDDCGNGLPCTIAGSSGATCAHLAPDPLSEQCKKRLQDKCAGLEGKGGPCDTCVRQHATDLRSHGCPEQGAPVFAWWCEGAPTPKGHHVCDVNLSTGAANVQTGDRVRS